MSADMLSSYKLERVRAYVKLNEKSQQLQVHLKYLNLFKTRKIPEDCVQEKSK